MAPPGHIVLWTGPKHSGKTTAAFELVEALRADGFLVAGLLAPSVCRAGELAGFDAVDAATARRAPLARRTAGPADIGEFAFIDAGCRLATSALSAEATAAADLVVVDEFGPLELLGRGWREAVDRLASEGSILLLVVREELAEQVSHLYAGRSVQGLPAGRTASAERIRELLSRRDLAGIRLMGAILAGGRAARLGQAHKGLIECAPGVTIVARLVEQMRSCALTDVIVVANDPGPYRTLARPIIPDLRPGLGPLAGVEAALARAAAAGCQAVAFLPCDLPAITGRQIRTLIRAFLREPARIVTAVTPDGPRRRHPTCCIVPTVLLPRVRRALDARQLRIGRLWAALGAVEVVFAEAAPFFNINTPEDLAAWRRRPD